MIKDQTLQRAGKYSMQAEDRLQRRTEFSLEMGGNTAYGADGGLPGAYRQGHQVVFAERPESGEGYRLAQVGS